MLRTRCAGNPRFTDFLAHVSETVLDALEGQDFPFPLLVEKLKVTRDPGRAPLCDVLFSWDKPHYRAAPGAGLRFETREVRQLGSTHDLAMIAFERADRIDVAIQYSTDLFADETIARMAGHFSRLLHGIANDPGQRLGDLPLLGDDERRTLLVDWNATRTDFPRDRCVHELFEEIVTQWPDAPAVRAGDRTFSYRALDDRANTIAGALRARGVGRGTMVGVALRRTPDAIAALLGILKTGGVYVGLDPGYPASRLAAAIRDVRAPVLVAEPSAASALSALGAEVVVLDQLAVRGGGPGLDPPIAADRSSAEDLAYVIFTSGSTGTPKGVGVPHRAIVRLVRNTNYLTVASSDVFLHSAPLPFDASTFEIWGPLLNGGLVVLLENGTPSLEDIGSTVRDHGVTVLWLTAGLFHLMVDQRLDDLRGLRVLLAGGDVLSPAHVAKFRAALPQVQLVNGYGPTENTTFTTCHRVASAPPLGASVSIGRPIANTTVYVLDDRMQPVPIGVPGELWTGGDGLAVGYVNAPELTAQRFVPDPFSSIAGARLYRTGDLVRYRPSGDLEFVGRRDQQVKVRGFRVELGEVEEALRRLPGVRDCAAVVSGGPAEDKRLIAYVVPVAPAPESTGLRAALAQSLPDHAVPSQFVFLDTLPLSANGKVDRARLPAPAHAPVPTAVAAPETDAEAIIADVWKTALGQPQVGRHDNFFDLGGHSLLVVRVHAELQRRLDPELTVLDFFRYPTVSGLAGHLAGRELEAARPEPTAGKTLANRLAQSRRLAQAKQRRGVQ